MQLDPHLVMIAVPIMVVTYVLVMVDRFDRSILALLGAGAMILAGVLTQDQAVRGIDFNTIGLLTGMMVLVAVSRRSGVFEYLAVRAAQVVRASPIGLLAMLAVVTAVLSALLDNVTTVLLIAPVTISITGRLGVASFPFLFTEVMASNFGGTATLIGDPPNILIGSTAGLSFNQFLIHLAPVVVVVLAVQIAISHLLWGRRMSATTEARHAILALHAADSITDARLLRDSVVVFALVLAGFTTARTTGLEPGSIALIGAALLMLLENLARPRAEQFAAVSATYGEVDWITIFFFVGLFIVVTGVEASGALGWLAQEVMRLTHGDLTATTFIVLWVSALASAAIDNIPFVAAMIPVIHAMAGDFGGEQAILPLWLALSLGACFGGNGTLVGASANLTVAGAAQRAGIEFGFAAFTKRALPMMVLSVLIAQAYLYLRYLS